MWETCIQIEIAPIPACVCTFWFIPLSLTQRYLCPVCAHHKTSIPFPHFSILVDRIYTESQTFTVIQKVESVFSCKNCWCFCISFCSAVQHKAVMIIFLRDSHLWMIIFIMLYLMLSKQDICMVMCNESDILGMLRHGKCYQGVTV